MGKGINSARRLPVAGNVKLESDNRAPIYTWEGRVGFWLSAKRNRPPRIVLVSSIAKSNTNFCRWRTFVSIGSSLETDRTFFGGRSGYSHWFSLELRASKSSWNEIEFRWVHLLELNGSRRAQSRPDTHTHTHTHTFTAIFQRLFPLDLSAGMQFVCRALLWIARHVRYASYTLRPLRIMATLVRHLI